MAGVDEGFAEISALSDRVDFLEKANQALQREKEQLAELLTKSGELATPRTTRRTFNLGSTNVLRNPCSDAGDTLDRWEEDDDAFESLRRLKYRLLWQNAIQAARLGHQNCKVLLLKGECARTSRRLERANADIAQLRLSVRETKKVQDVQSARLEQNKKAMEQMRRKHSMVQANMAKEKFRMEEEFSSQLEGMSMATHAGKTLDCSLADQMQISHSKSWSVNSVDNDDCDDDGDEWQGSERFDSAESLQERIVALEEALQEEKGRSEQLLEEEEMKRRMQVAIAKPADTRPASGEEESGRVKKLNAHVADLTAAKLSLGKRVKELERQLTEVIAQAGDVARLDRDDEDSSLDEELQEEILMLQQELADSRQAELQWRETAMMSYWQRFTNHFCASTARKDAREAQVDGARASLFGELDTWSEGDEIGSREDSRESVSF